MPLTLDSFVDSDIFMRYLGGAPGHARRGAAKPSRSPRQSLPTMFTAGNSSSDQDGLDEEEARAPEPDRDMIQDEITDWYTCDDKEFFPEDEDKRRSLSQRVKRRVVRRVGASATPSSPVSSDDEGVSNASDDASGTSDDEGVSSEGFIEVDGNGIPMKPKGKKPKKRKKLVGGGTEVTSPLQSIHWFRVVLDEAQ